MKRIVRFILAATMLSGLFACGKENGEVVPEDKTPTGITLSESSFSAEASGASFTLTVTAPSRPSVSGMPEWIAVEDGTFKNYSITFTVKVTENKEYDSRNATCTVTAGSLSKTFTVSQAAAEKPVDPVPEDPVEFDKSNIDKAPVNSKASAEAVKLYDFLLEVFGSKTLSGVQSSMSHTNDFVNAVYNATGKHPALAGYDFIYLQFSPTPAGWSWKQDYTDISAQQEHWKAHGIISYMWHWNVPETEAIYRGGGTDGYGFYVPGAHGGNGETPFDIREAVKDGTWQHECILAQIDEIAITFKKLQAAGIPVLFRPLHEAAGNYTRYNPNGGAWFWWGRYGAKYCKQLWDILRDRLENHHGLDNLLWVWTIDVAEGFESAAKEWYPGNDKVDVVGADIYENNTGVKTSQFDFINKVTGGKKILTVSECGNIPEPGANIRADKPWSWFLVWPSADSNGNIQLTPDSWNLNTLDYWRQLMGSSYVITRENMREL